MLRGARLHWRTHQPPRHTRSGSSRVRGTWSVLEGGTRKGTSRVKKRCFIPANAGDRRTEGKRVPAKAPRRRAVSAHPYQTAPLKVPFPHRVPPIARGRVVGQGCCAEVPTRKRASRVTKCCFDKHRRPLVHTLHALDDRDDARGGGDRVRAPRRARSSRADNYCVPRLVQGIQNSRRRVRALGATPGSSWHLCGTPNPFVFVELGSRAVAVLSQQAIDTKRAVHGHERG